MHNQELFLVTTPMYQNAACGPQWMELSKPLKCFQISEVDLAQLQDDVYVPDNGNNHMNPQRRRILLILHIQLSDTRYVPTPDGSTEAPIANPMP